jgi:hypothetical protein
MTAGEPDTPHHVQPDAGLVPDATTACAIAVAVWGPIYGAERIARQAPHRAALIDGIWHVSGTLPRRTLGGTAIAEIARNATAASCA